jgi:hypothetical protein
MPSSAKRLRRTLSAPNDMERAPNPGPAHPGPPASPLRAARQSLIPEGRSRQRRDLTVAGHHLPQVIPPFAVHADQHCSCTRPKAVSKVSRQNEFEYPMIGGARQPGADAGFNTHQLDVDIDDRKLLVGLFRSGKKVADATKVIVFLERHFVPV